MSEQENNALAFVRWIQELVDSYDRDLKAVNTFVDTQSKHNDETVKALERANEFTKAQTLKLEGLEKEKTKVAGIYQQLDLIKKENIEQQIKIDKLEKTVSNIEAFLARAYK